ncbi:MAG: hypothetical protein ACI86M_000015 [Saprospiraceae bacterium]|jgi:hypothetical protein
MYSDEVNIIGWSSDLRSKMRWTVQRIVNSQAG